MYLRLSLDPRILLPLVMLGGLAASVGLYQGSGRGVAQASELAGHHAARRQTDVPMLADMRPRETLPTLLDPAVSLRPAATASAGRSLLGRPTSLPFYATNERKPDSNGVNPAPSVPPDGLVGGDCPEGMLMVEGDYCQVVGHVCLKRIDGPVERCEKYAEPPICEGQIQKKRFCIDRFEYPNLEGVRPAVMVNWVEAKGACEAEGKRLCTGSEWTLACEGAERVPYPYGYTRDSTACNIDRPHPNVDEQALLSPRDVSGEVARLDQRVASGQMARCKSPYGVQDMTGNVDEWVLNEKHFGPAPSDGSERPFISGLKGGYWGPVRNRCRATTTFHNEWFRFYQIGFRCCANSPQSTPSP
jgi:Sulfatase-modifying factor enzyme 1